MEQTGSKPVAALHILHGMMEHSGRYAHMAQWFEERNMAVYCDDLPNHGINTRKADDLGHLDAESWIRMMDHVAETQQRIRNEHPGLPVFILGHSFGSLVARAFVQDHSSRYPISGLILSGAMQQPSLLLRAGLGLIALQSMFYGQRHRSKLMISLGHGRYARDFEGHTTSFDWLSSDPRVVGDYFADPLCGYACTLGYYRYFFMGLLRTFHCSGIRKYPPELPVLLVSGSLDPAVRNGLDTRKLARRFRAFGMKRVETSIFEGGRHEMHNETNKFEIWELYRTWITRGS
jgi:alpha-beta hydrolase superfamily lysophospholipase